MRIRVDTYSGYKADERPLRFVLRERTYEVESVEDQWHSPEATWFRVRTQDGDLYVLRHARAEDEWTVESFRKA